MDIEKILKELTLEEKAALVAGRDFMYTNSVPRLNIPPLCTADGPHGLRKQTKKNDNGMSGSEPSTAFPTATALASGWNTENAKKMGAAIAKECRYYGVDVLLGPGMNIKRNPLCGRNFEYFSEDPLLAGEIAAAAVKGIQSEGVGACVKHFALNNAENFRFMGDSIADMRAVREIYLSAFERVIKKAKPYAVMCAYNKINGVPCSENKLVLKDILRGEWGFDGVIMTDWGAMRERVPAIKAGLDLEMPGDTKYCRKSIIGGVKSGALQEEDLDGCVRNILELIAKCSKKQRAESADFEAHHGLAAEIAEDCAVLMKNDGSLPFLKSEEILVVGELFESMRYQGAGSSMINPAMLTSPKTAFDKRGIKYRYERGYAANKLVSDGKMIESAVQAAENFDKVLVFAGLTDYVEFEGADRENMRLPENQLALIDALIAAGKKVIVVLFGGSSAELPFADKASAILNMFLPGQNGGTACANLIFGDKNPCGKLAESWVKTYADVPFGEEFSKTVKEVYKESVLVGYRYYLTANKKVTFPFGFGLSYTQFEYSDLSVCADGNKITASCIVTNTGERAGAEVVQLYVKAPEYGVFKPKRELKAFCKIYLNAGESKRAEMTFDRADLRYFNILENRYVTEGGEYEVQICSDCQTVKLAKTLDIAGDNAKLPYLQEINEIYSKADICEITDGVFEQMSGIKIPALPPVKPITMESRFTDLRYTFFGKILFNAIVGIPKRQIRRAQKMPEGVEKETKIKGAMFLLKILESGCLRSMSMSSTLLPYNVAEGLKELSNGHIFRAIARFCSRIRVKKLPKK